MKKWKLVTFALVFMLGCLILVPVACAASTFATDLDLYRTRNKATSDDTRELVAYVADGRLFARSLGKVGPRTSSAIRSYVTTLDNLDSLTRRIVRDQRSSERLLADVLKLASRNYTAAAWTLLKRGLAGQERFLKTISSAQTLMAKCKVLRAQLTPAGG
ncbi:hypothetical protein LLF88_01320 [bacterium]|nr:hypothetical protein [bacterium]